MPIPGENRSNAPRADRLKTDKKRSSEILDTIKFLWEFLKTPDGMWLILAVVSIAGLLIFVDRKRQIPKLLITQNREKSWFATLEDNRSQAVIVSLNLSNRSGIPIRLRKCNLGGYSPMKQKSPLVLGINKKSIELEIPENLFCNGEEQIVQPYAEMTFFAFYKFRLVTMTNILRTRLVLKDAKGKHSSIEVQLLRETEQIGLYQKNLAI